ncbi:MAG: amidase [Deltaproteobacteria bacterium]|nr:amidase [Deltaproteobacteria bacterium]
MSAPTIGEVLWGFSRDTLSPSELLEALVQRIENLDEKLGVYVTLDIAAAREAARAADAAWRQGRARPLEGVPIAIKDNMDVAGMPTTCCHPRWREAAPVKDDAAVVQRLRNAGAVLLGKSQMHELALGITGENPSFRTARNPHAPARISGGSTSGGAASVAAGLALAAIGSDTGGSTRVPAALCGLVGFKPTFDRLPRQGLFPVSRSMDHVGLITQGIADMQRLFAAIEERDFKEEEPTKPTRVGFLQPALEAASFETRQPLEGTMSLLVEQGVDVEMVPCEHWQEIAETYQVILTYEAAEVHAEALASDDERARFGDDVLALLQRGLEIDDDTYAKALTRRQELATLLDACLEGHDLLLTPTTSVTAPLIGETQLVIADKEVLTRDALLTATCPFSMVGLPALSLPLHPMGTSPDWHSPKLPVGLQVVGRRDEDLRLLEHAAWIESILSWGN